MSRPMRRARSTDCTISSCQAAKKFAIDILHPNIDRAVAETLIKLHDVAKSSGRCGQYFRTRHDRRLCHQTAENRGINVAVLEEAEAQPGMHLVETSGHNRDPTSAQISNP